MEIINKSNVAQLSSHNQFAISSVADPDDFCPDPDPTFQNVRIRILTEIKFSLTFDLPSRFIKQKVKIA
jgi:hypothetical protein